MSRRGVSFFSILMMSNTIVSHYICTKEELQYHFSNPTANKELADLGLADLKYYMPPFIESIIPEMMSKNKLDNGSQILEIGCGNGRSVLELQDIIVTSTISCLNTGAAPLETMDPRLAMFNTALIYNIPIHCKQNSKPILPVVHSLYGKPGFLREKLPFTKDNFDLILSRNNFHAGQVASTDPRYIVPRIGRLLKEGGYASIMLIPNNAHVAFPSLSLVKFNVAKVFMYFGPDKKVDQIEYNR